MLRVVTFFHKLSKDAVLWNKSVNVNSQFVLDQRCFFFIQENVILTKAEHWFEVELVSLWFH